MRNVFPLTVFTGLLLVTLGVQPALAGCNERCVACDIGHLSISRCANVGFETGMSCGGAHGCGEDGKMSCYDTLCGTPVFLQPEESRNNSPVEIVGTNCRTPVLMSVATTAVLLTSAAE